MTIAQIMPRITPVQITPIPGAYMVTIARPNRSIEVFRVGKDKTCTCGHNGDGNGGGPHCAHVRAVADYLKAGGKRAPEAQSPTQMSTTTSEATIPDHCPVCGAAVRKQVLHHNRYTGEVVQPWRCTQASSHYWQWRLEHDRREPDKDAQARQRARLAEVYRATGASEAKIASLFDDTWEERQAFLDAARDAARAWPNV